uniref:Uncharacterized protein n=1 Tax=Meleagris gallopavo TaxID=9103 RepID=A0A803XMN9_MELGA
MPGEALTRRLCYIYILTVENYQGEGRRHPAPPAAPGDFQVSLPGRRGEGKGHKARAEQRWVVIGPGEWL